ncbi:sugar transporter (hexose transporter) [Penicillium argentinense]|uniref:Sugar transporter (Hexose transporter) n=1 Tax=Penicillium argentinense TaxID=1131581 RepID=A0A9W9FF12_9EURO|nr:sugar transporter (hexose transporter) [Penicillium argentinense]KAJ5098884.1 sugar transporter (hexose transporter) [Penicillium argentinense]
MGIQPIWPSSRNLARCHTAGNWRSHPPAAPRDSAFIVGRLVVGASSGLLKNSAPLLLNEITYPVANSPFICGYYFGALIAAWVTFGTHVLDPSGLGAFHQSRRLFARHSLFLTSSFFMRVLDGLSRYIADYRTAFTAYKRLGMIKIQQTLDMEEKYVKSSGWP